MRAVSCCGNLKGENTPQGETSNPLPETGGITWVMMECSSVHFVPWRHNLCSLYLWVSLELLTLDFKQKRKSLCSPRPNSQGLLTLSFTSLVVGTITFYNLWDIFSFSFYWFPLWLLDDRVVCFIVKSGHCANKVSIYFNYKKTVILCVLQHIHSCFKSFVFFKMPTFRMFTQFFTLGILLVNFNETLEMDFMKYWNVPVLKARTLSIWPKGNASTHRYPISQGVQGGTSWLIFTHSKWSESIRNCRLKNQVIMKFNAEISWWNVLMAVYVMLNAWQKEKEGEREGLPDWNNTALGFGQEKHTMSQRVNTCSLGLELVCFQNSDNFTPFQLCPLFLHYCLSRLLNTWDL